MITRARTIGNKIRRLSLKRQLALLFLISILPVFLSLTREGKSEKLGDGVLGPQSIDTLIPTGFALVPIEVQNSESLDSILGNKGVVNLLAPPREAGKKSRLIARRVPILRAPLNPSHFAVLVPESISRDITQEQGPFWVVIQNPNESGMSFEKKNFSNRPNARIIDGGVD